MPPATAPPPRRPPSAVPTGPLTAEEFVRLPDTRGKELFRGRVLELPVPGFVHGLVCNRTAHRLTRFADEHDLGRVLTNDSHLQVPTDDGSGTDTVRGMDVAFFSWDRVPRETRPIYLPPNPPEFIVEVRSPSDRPGDILRKVGEYLARGVDLVAVADPERRTVHPFTVQNDLPDPLREDDVLTPGPFLPGFSVKVGELFDV